MSKFDSRQLILGGIAVLLLCLFAVCGVVAVANGMQWIGSSSVVVVTIAAPSSETSTPRVTPTMTPLPPTAILTPLPSATYTAMVPTITVTRASSSGGCYAYSGVFTSFWNSVSNQLGCYRGTEFVDGVGAAQPFVGGRMIWSDGLDYIYAFGSNGAWTGVPDKWVDGMPTYTCAAGQRAGVIRGFGIAWCNSSYIQTLVDSATGIEYRVLVTVAIFENGIILRSEGVTRVAYNTGLWQSK